MKLMFLPISVLGGLCAAQLSKKVFDFVWTRVDDEEAPRPKYREIAIPKLIAALVIEGALFRVVKGLVDHGARKGFEKTLGTWPGEEAPDPA